MPGYNEESIRKTPLLELYEAGVRFRKSLDTLIREAATARVTPDEIDQFLAKQPSLEEAVSRSSRAACRSGTRWRSSSGICSTWMGRCGG